ncbi:hypothetical protein [Thioclava pacifica]|nr:hypothetical protein [Thioclava pacifica]
MRLGREIRGLGRRDEADRVEAVAFREAFRLAQGLARDHSDLHGLPAAREIIDQIRNRIRGHAFKRGFDLAAALRGAGAGRVDRAVEDLRIRQDELGRKSARRDCARLVAQCLDCGAGIVAFQRNLAQKPPTLLRAMHQGDAVMRKDQCKIGFHFDGLGPSGTRDTHIFVK